MAEGLPEPGASVPAGDRRGRPAPRRQNEERLLELEAVIDVLREVMRDEPARLWLRSPVPALDYDKPMDLIEQGEYRRVIGAILSIGEGVTAWWCSTRTRIATAPRVAHAGTAYRNQGACAGLAGPARWRTT